MKLSYKKLQEYFEEKLPAPEALAEVLSMHVWEVDGIEDKDGDSILDIKVLPDRAVYGNSPLGVAREVSAILGLELNKSKVEIVPKAKPSEEIVVSVDFINQKLGTKLSVKEIIELLKKQEISVTEEDKNLKICSPAWRNDLNITEDIPEEVGRLFGYDKIVPVLPPIPKTSLEINKIFYFENKIRLFLSGLGFSEIYSSSFRKKGDLEVLKPVASDKSHLRNELSTAMKEILDFNFHSVEFLGLKQIKLFEIGRVFGGGMEKSNLCIGILNTKSIKKKVNEEIREVREALLKYLEVNLQTVCTIDDSGGIIMLSNSQIGTINTIDGILELDLGKLIEILPEPKVQDVIIPENREVKYKPFSRFPFIARDVAFFANVSDDDFESVLLSGLSDFEKNLIVKGPTLFDKFVKGERVSVGFRFIFQAFDRTLTDDEIKVIMDKIYQTIKNKGWEVR